MITWIAQATSAAPAAPAGLPITLGVSLVLGLFLWVMGRKLVRVAISLSGLVVGAAAAFVLADALRKDGAVSDGLMLVWMIGGAIVGVLGAWFLFRGWMALSMGALAALLAPAALVVWTGTPPPAADPATPPPLTLNTQTPPPPAPAPIVPTPNPITPKSLTGKTETPDPDKDKGDAKTDLPVSKFSMEDIGITAENIEDAKKTVIQVINQVYHYQRSYLEAWWLELKSTGQRNVTITLAIAGLAGALLGFVLPYFSASIQTALVGAAILLSSVRGLLAQYAPDQTGWLPSEPRSLLITLGLITLTGVVIQWTLWRGAADK
ncbi:MAG: hypothetical protein WD768_02940 [Phycisphaeraceae bacterium]